MGNRVEGYLPFWGVEVVFKQATNATPAGWRTVLYRNGTRLKENVQPLGMRGTFDAAIQAGNLLAYAAELEIQRQTAQAISRYVSGPVALVLVPGNLFNIPVSGKPTTHQFRICPEDELRSLKSIGQSMPPDRFQICAEYEDGEEDPRRTDSLSNEEWEALTLLFSQDMTNAPATLIPDLAASAARLESMNYATRQINGELPDALIYSITTMGKRRAIREYNHRAQWEGKEPG